MTLNVPSMLVRWLMLLTVVYAIGACSPANSPASVTSTNTPNDQNGAYPVPPPPATAQPPSPLPVTGKAFQMQRPLVAGSTTLAGVGPNNIPILAISVTLNGEELGHTVIQADGNFKMTLSTPLVEGARVGIAVGPVEKNVGQNFDFMERLYNLRGPGYMFIPNLAQVYDSALVDPKQ